jgi:cytochrome b
MTQRVLVWDVPTRIFHWFLAVSFAGAFLTAESERFRDIHIVTGYTMLALITFRLIWGFIGSRYARFRSFIFKPGEIVEYITSLIKGNSKRYVGHNPAGSIAIFVLLALGIAIGATGIMLMQDSGGDTFEEMHELFSNAMLAVVFIHVAGVIVSGIKQRENLVRSMITGYKSARQDDGISRPYIVLGVIMTILIVAFWIGYPATGIVSPSNSLPHAERHNDDD